MSGPPRDGPSRWRLAEGVALLAVALGAIVFQLVVPTTHVAEADYRAVAAVLEQEAQVGDVVLLFPWWTERARLYLPQRLPIVGYLGSERDDLTHHPRVWVLGEPRLPRSDAGGFEAAFLPGRTPLGSERRFGNLSLRAYTNGRFRPLAFSAIASIEEASVSLEEPNKASRPCPWNGRAHQCPNGKAVAVEWHEVHFRPLRCLRLDAPGGATRLVVELPPAPAADAVVVEAGYIGERAADPRGSVTDSQITLEVNGTPMILSIPAGVERLHHLEHPAIPAGARVRLSLQSDNAQGREICAVLDGYSRPP